MERDDFSWITARAMRAGELFSLYRVDHALGFYRTYFALDRRRDAAASRRPTSADADRSSARR